MRACVCVHVFIRLLLCRVMCASGCVCANYLAAAVSMGINVSVSLYLYIYLYIYIIYIYVPVCAYVRCMLACVWPRVRVGPFARVYVWSVCACLLVLAHIHVCLKIIMR